MNDVIWQFFEQFKVCILTLDIPQFNVQDPISHIYFTLLKLEQILVLALDWTVYVLENHVKNINLNEDEIY